jgi:hypothetical protein
LSSETKTSLERKVDLLLGLVSDLRKQTSSPEPLKKRWLSTADVGSHVGRSARTIANWVQQGRFPSHVIKKVKRGNSYVIRLDGQDALAAAQQIVVGDID